MKTKYIYAVRNKNTGKLVSDLSSKSKKFWWRKADAEKAIHSPYCHYKTCNLELVTFELVEVKED